MQHFIDPYMDYTNAADMTADGSHLEVGANWGISSANLPHAYVTQHLRFAYAGAAQLSQGGATKWRRGLKTAVDTLGFAFRHYINVLPTDEIYGNNAFAEQFVLQNLKNSSNRTQTLYSIGTDGSIGIFRGDAGINGAYTGNTEIARTDPGIILADTYQHIETKTHISTTVGTAEIRINGVEVFNETGLNTHQTGTAAVTQLEIGHYGQAHGARTIDISDMHTWDDDDSDPNLGPSDFVGNVIALKRNLIADTAEADFTLSTGTDGFDLLADNDLATYIIGLAADDRSRFVVEDFPPEIYEVINQQLNAYAVKTDAGDASLQMGAYHNAVEDLLDINAMSVTAARYRSMCALNPDTLAQWDPADALEMILKRTL